MKKILALILFPVLLFAQDEILINSFSDDNQRAPVIAGKDSEGNFAIIWTSENQADISSGKDIIIKFFANDFSNPTKDIVANDYIYGEQEYPALAMNSSGKTVVAWTSYNPQIPENKYDIKAKIYINGIEAASEFLVNSFIENSQTVPSIDINESGEFVIVWESWNQDGSERGIYAQRFDETGDKVGGEFRVNSATDFSQAKPKVKYLPNGKFIIVWESWNEAQKGYDLFAKIFDESGNVIINEKRINEFTDNYQWFADVDINSKNEIAIAWCSWEQDGYDGGIYLNLFDEELNPLATETLVNNSKRFYQWLPKIKFLNENDLAILWSGWKTDGSREGIYYRLIKAPDSNKNFKFLNQEARLNDFTEGYQWEPDFIIEDEKILSVWSCWNQFGEMYDIVGKAFEPTIELGILEPDEVKHIRGTTSSKIEVRIINSGEIINHQYEISFEGEEEIFMNIKDIDSDETKVSQFPLNLGEDVFYATDKFDGISVQIEPEFKLGLNEEKTNFDFSSNTNIIFEVKESSINKSLAPVNVVFWFGPTDTLSNGNYAAPSDTAFNTSLNKVIEVPFKANATVFIPYRDLEFIVLEKRQNNKWDPGEKILIRTPEIYRENEFETFLEINSTSPENLIMPEAWDVINIYMNKPITTDDVFRFRVDSSSIILDVEEKHIVREFELYQNYPNPFNPSTTIEYSIPRASKINLQVFDILGQRIETLVDEFQASGKYSINWNPKNISSGIYFYLFEAYDLNGNKISLSKKMIYLK